MKTIEVKRETRTITFADEIDKLLKKLLVNNFVGDGHTVMQECIKLGEYVKVIKSDKPVKVKDVIVRFTDECEMYFEIVYDFKDEKGNYITGELNPQDAFTFTELEIIEPGHFLFVDYERSTEEADKFFAQYGGDDDNE